LRNSVWTVNSSATGPNNVIGVLADGDSTSIQPTNTYASPNAIQRSTINVVTNGTGVTRGIYINGPNHMSVRDIVVYVSPASTTTTGFDIMGVETNNPQAYIEIKTSTINGSSLVKGTTSPDASGSFHDISRTNGNMVIGATDLYNNNPNVFSFTPTVAPSSVQYGILGDLPNGNKIYYLAPGSIPIASLPAQPAPFIFIHASTIISIAICFSSLTTINSTITFNVYKTSTSALVMTLPITATGTVTLTSQSVNFAALDSFYTTITYNGNPHSGTFSAVIGYY